MLLDQLPRTFSLADWARHPVPFAQSSSYRSKELYVSLWMGGWSHLNPISLQTGCCLTGEEGAVQQHYLYPAVLPVHRKQGQEGSCCTGHTHVIGLSTGISWGSWPWRAFQWTVHGMKWAANRLHSGLKCPDGCIYGRSDHSPASQAGLAGVWAPCWTK